MALIIDDLVLDPHLFPGLGRYHVWALVLLPFPDVFAPDLALFVDAASVHRLQGHAVAVEVELRQVSGRVRLHVAAAANGYLPVHPADAVPDAGLPVAVSGCSQQALPVFHAGLALPVFHVGQAPVFDRPAD